MKSSIRIKSISIEECWILCLLVVNTSFFHLVSISDLSGITVPDLEVIICCVFGFLVYLKYGFSPAKGLFSRISLFTVILVFYGAIIPHILFGQDLLRGFTSQRILLVGYLSYFPLYVAFTKGRLTREKIIKIVCLVGIIEAIVVTAQCLMMGKFSFTTLSMEWDSRDGGHRLRIFGYPILFAFFYWLEAIIKGTKRKGKLLGAVLTLVVFFFFVRIRMLIMGISAIIVISILTVKTKNQRKIFFILLITAVMIAALHFNVFDFAFSAIKSLSNITDFRTIGRKYFLEAIIKRPMLGYGFPNINCLEAINAAGENYGIYIVDNGLFGFTYMYGLIGLAWWMIAYIYPLSVSNKCNGLWAEKMLLLFQIIIIASLVYIIQDVTWCLMNTVVFCIFNATNEESKKNEICTSINTYIESV